VSCLQSETTKAAWQRYQEQCWTWQTAQLAFEWYLGEQAYMHFIDGEERQVSRPSAALTVLARMAFKFFKDDRWPTPEEAVTLPASLTEICKGDTATAARLAGLMLVQNPDLLPARDRGPNGQPLPHVVAQIDQVLAMSDAEIVAGLAKYEQKGAQP
jgi:hypothetical protein